MTDTFGKLFDDDTDSHDLAPLGCVSKRVHERPLGVLVHQLVAPPARSPRDRLHPMRQVLRAPLGNSVFVLTDDLRHIEIRAPERKQADPRRTPPLPHRQIAGQQCIHHLNGAIWESSSRSHEPIFDTIPISPAQKAPWYQ